MFTAASEPFSQKNTNCSIDENIKRFEPVLAVAKSTNTPVRGYISCVVDCPYEGEVDVDIVRDITRQLLAMGCYEISLGDTTGIGTTGSIAHMLGTVTQNIAINKLAVHFHDTYDQAIANIYVALERGISVIDSSVAGLGGCP